MLGRNTFVKYLTLNINNDIISYKLKRERKDFKMKENLRENQPYIIETLFQLIDEQRELAITYAKRFAETDCALYFKKSKTHTHIANTLRKEVARLRNVSEVLK